MTEIVNISKLIIQVVGVRMRTARRNEEDPAQDQTGPQFIGSVFVTFSSKEVAPTSIYITARPRMLSYPLPFTIFSQ